MLGNPFSYLTDKRKRFGRTDTASSVELNNNSNNTNVFPNRSTQSSDDSMNKSPNESEQTNRPNLFVAESNSLTSTESRERKQSQFQKCRASSPPSKIKYRIRHKSPGAGNTNKTSEYHRKHSDTTVFILQSRSNRSHSIDHSQKLRDDAKSTPSPMNDTNLMKLSRSFSKRMPRSGSAKNLTELRDDLSLIWSDGKFMQREIGLLFKAVDNNDLKTVESLLNSHPGIVNNINNIDLTPLDVAMLCNYSTLAKRIIESGGRNSACFENDPKLLHRHLTIVANNCASQMLEMCSHIYVGSMGSVNRDLEVLDALHRQIAVLKTNYEQMKPGSPPRKVTLEVAGLHSLLVTVSPPSDSIVTRYRIEWSQHADFSELDDEIIVRTQFPIGRYQICDLSPRMDYFVRVSSINLKGTGTKVPSVPASCRPSCWTEVVVEDSEFTGSRRCPHAQQWALTRFDAEETRMEQQLQFWLASIRSHNKAIQGVGGDSNNELNKLSIPGITGRKSLLKALFSSSSKFLRQPKHGLYLALVIRAADTDKVLSIGEDQLPFVLVDEDQPSLQAINVELIWFMRLLANQPELRLLVEVLGRMQQVPASVQLRVRLMFAALQLQLTLGNRDIGLPSSSAIHEPNYSVIVLARQVPVAKQISLQAGLKWTPVAKLTRYSSNNINDSVSSQSGLEEELYGRIDSFISFGRRVGLPMEDGLYLGYVRFRSSLDQLYIQQHMNNPNGFPVVKVRDNWHVDRDEWAHMMALREGAEQQNTVKKGSKLQSALVRAWQKLQEVLRLRPEDRDHCRLYLEEVLWVRPRCRVVLVVPSLEDFCGVPGSEIPLPTDYDWVPLHAFEFYHFFAHLADDNAFLSWATLTSTLEVLLPLAHQSLRQGFDQHEIDQSRERLEQFQDIQYKLEQYWRCLRWSVDVINNCRDRQTSVQMTIPIERVISTDAAAQTVLCTEVHCPESVVVSPFGNCSTPSELSGKHVSSSESEPSPLPKRISRSPIRRPPFQATPSQSESPSTPDIPVDTENDHCETPPRKQAHKGTLRVYAGYPCGLLEGTSVKILLTSQTTTADVISLIVRQLNATAFQRNTDAPQYSDDDFKKFCLVVSIDKMSRPLPDNFHPLLLKQPWKSGKLTVKLKSDPTV